MRRWRRSRPHRHRRGGWIGKAVAIVALLGAIFLFWIEIASGRRSHGGQSGADHLGGGD